MKRCLVCLLAVLAAMSGTVQADPVLTAEYTEPDGLGFFDETPVAVVPGNPGKTLGEQRRFVFERALDILASYIDSDVTIRINAAFVDLPCSTESNARRIAQGGNVYRSINFRNAPRSNVYYPASLAVHLAGEPLHDSFREGYVQFALGADADPDCFNRMARGFWYGIGEPPPPGSSSISFLSLALHELGHALGFYSMTNPTTREFPGNPPRPGIHSQFVYSWDHRNNWPGLTAAERLQSAASERGLVWSGASGNLWAAEVLLPPGEVQGRFDDGRESRLPARVHGPRPLPPREGLSRPLAVASNPVEASGIDGIEDEPRRDDDACEPLDNVDAVNGRVLLVVRGGCYFRTKWRHAEAAGAAALLVVDHLPTDDPRAMSRDQWVVVPPDVSIPLWTLPRETGMSWISDPPDRVVLGYDFSAALPGVRADLLSLMSGPDWNDSSRVSHVSVDTLPQAWMGTSLDTQHGNFHGHVDMMPGLLRDLGWRDFSGKRGQWVGNWYDPSRSGEGCQLTLERDGETWILTCYIYEEGDQKWLIGSGSRDLNRIAFEPMNVTSGTGYGVDFDADEVTVAPWGRIDVEFISCNHASFRFVPEDESMLPMDRFYSKIAPGDCRLSSGSQPDRSRSGNFYNAERSGEGIQVSQEADGESVVMTWYSYRDGEQFWAIGTGRFDEAREVLTVDALSTTRGGDYGPAFDPESVEIIPFGSAQLRFIDCNNAELTVNSDLEGFGTVAYPVTRIVAGDCN
jgi:hypothetical protein